MSGFSLILSSKLFFEVLKNLQFGRPLVLINLVEDVSIAAANLLGIVPGQQLLKLN